MLKIPFLTRRGVLSRQGLEGDEQPGEAAIMASNASRTNKAEDTNQFGMFILREPLSIGPGEVDIVAIHGLNGHFLKTWSSESVFVNTTAFGPANPQANLFPKSSGRRPVNWLMDFLPEKVPEARIMSFGYNSIVAFSKSGATINTFAEQLLENLIACRETEEEQSRRIIFICHSLGGIVFKQVSPLYMCDYEIEYDRLQLTPAGGTCSSSRTGTI
jgi:hypothetical protein